MAEEEDGEQDERPVVPADSRMDGQLREGELAAGIDPFMGRRAFREDVRRATGERYREVHVDETTWDYLMQLKKVFGLDNLRQAALLMKDLAVYGVKRRREGAEE